MKIGIFTVMFRFPNLKLKAPDQPQSAGKKVLTNDITWLLVQHLVKVFIKIESNSCFSYSEIESKQGRNCFVL